MAQDVLQSLQVDACAMSRTVAAGEDQQPCQITWRWWQQLLRCECAAAAIACQLSIVSSCCLNQVHWLLPCNTSWPAHCHAFLEPTVFPCGVALLDNA